MDMGRIPPSEMYRRASFQADSLGETPIRRGYASGAYPPRIRIGYVSDTDTGSPARIGVTEATRAAAADPHPAAAGMVAPAAAAAPAALATAA